MYFGGRVGDGFRYVLSHYSTIVAVSRPLGYKSTLISSGLDTFLAAARNYSTTGVNYD